MLSIKDHLFIAVQYCIPQHSLSRVAGLLAETKIPWLKNWLIQRFIRQFNVNMNEAIHPSASSYSNFNDFFTRRLKPGVRTFETDPEAISSPADGVVSEAGSLKGQSILQAKGKSYSLHSLLAGDSKLAKTFSSGHFSTIYLSPKDYHRVHMPFDGVLIKTIYVPGKLFSVNQTTANHVDNLFARNERLICIFDTSVGKMAVILVGAMIVASIETAWGGQIAPAPKTPTTIDFSKKISLAKNDELGLFKLGSTVILLFEEGSMHWAQSLAKQKSLQVGQRIGNTV